MSSFIVGGGIHCGSGQIGFLSDKLDWNLNGKMFLLAQMSV